MEIITTAQKNAMCFHYSDKFSRDINLKFKIENYFRDVKRVIHSARIKNIYFAYEVT